MRLRGLAWRSTYRVQVRMVDQLQAGRVFLAGDAAHVHPIAGGLGMNTGIQDAYNLGWKLGLVLAGHAAPGLLGTYEEERLPIASWLLDITSERLAAVLDAIKEKGGGVDAGAAPELSQLTLGYPWSRLSAGPGAGERAPDAPLRDAGGHRIRLFDLFRGPHFTLLGLGERCAPAIGGIEAGPAAGIVRPYLVGPGGLADDGGHVARAYGTDALVLVRPDGYVGMVADPATASGWPSGSGLGLGREIITVKRRLHSQRGSRMELGLHIADFTWNGGAATLGPQLARHARNAEAAGIARITVMDHFWQISGVGPVEHEMLEAYTTLGFLAAHTERARLHTLVTGVVYRQPGLLAKQVSTLDVLSGGRAGLGIGAAWNAEESAGLGLPFPPVAERFERLEEAIQVCLQMWSDSEAPYDGTYYHLGRTLNSPQSLQRPHPYLMIGGSGEKKTLRLVAQYADACNLFGGPDSAHKLEVLRQHCDAVGRDYDEIEKTTMISVEPTTTRDEFLKSASALREAGFAATYVFAKDFTEPEKVIDLLGSAVPQLA